MKVTIYIETSFKGPAVKEGSYLSILEFITSKGETITKTIYEEKEKTTFNQLVIMAAVKSLMALKPCEVEIVTDCQFVINTIVAGRLKKWREEGWTSPKKNKELWKSLAKEINRMEKVNFKYMKNHSYKNYMQSKIEGKN